LSRFRAVAVAALGGDAGVDFANAIDLADTARATYEWSLAQIESADALGASDDSVAQALEELRSLGVVSLERLLPDVPYPRTATLATAR
jgi:hypothetical protein